MKKLLLITLLMTKSIYGQCDHNPIISHEGQPVTETLMLCPPMSNTTTITTQTGDSYQWIYRYCFPENAPWQNAATTQDFVIDYYEYSCTYVKVAVTTNGCTEESPEIFVDGYAFPLPDMLMTISDANFQQIGDFEFNICNGTNVVFSAELPYTNNIVWYNNGNSIPNETNTTLTITSDGTYVYSSCTEQCPNFCHPQNVPGPFPTKLNFGNFDFCNLGVKNPDKSNDMEIYPNPTTQLLFIGKAEDEIYTEIKIIDSSGKIALEINNHNYNKPIDVSSLASGQYIIISKSKNNKIYKNKFIKN